MLHLSCTDFHEQDPESGGFAQEFDGHDEIQDSRFSLEEIYHRPGVPHRVWPKLETSSCGALLLRLIVCAFAFWGFVDALGAAVRGLRSRLRTETPHCWCGTTDEQAIDMSCRYDHIAVDWLPDPCIDKDLVVEFDASGSGADGSWPYFELGNSTEWAARPTSCPSTVQTSMISRSLGDCTLQRESGIFSIACSRGGSNFGRNLTPLMSSHGTTTRNTFSIAAITSCVL